MDFLQCEGRCFGPAITALSQSIPHLHKTGIGIKLAERLKRQFAVDQSRLWKNVGLGAGFLAVLASPVALHAMVAPPPKPVTQPAQTASFVPTCSAAAQVVDSRPDPAWVGASFSGDNCWAPALPAAFDGTNASREQIVAAMATAKSYKAKADAYQRCIGSAVSSRKAAAEKTGEPLDAAFVTIETHRIKASEDNRKKADLLVAIDRAFTSDTIAPN